MQEIYNMLYTRESYLMTFTCEGELCNEILPMPRIAHIIGFRDCEYEHLENIRVYRILPDSIEPLCWEESLTGCTVSLYDQSGNLVDSGEFEDH